MNTLQLFPESEIIVDFQALYHAVAKQIEKDFHPHVRMSEAPLHLTSEWLYTELNRMLNEVVLHQNINFGAIIYRVDLSEKKVLSAMSAADTNERMKELTMMVLKREAQKVWIRYNYRE